MSYSPPGGDLSLSWSVSTELSRAPTIAGIPSSTSSSVTSSATGGGGRTVSSSDENYIIDFDYNKNNTGQVYDAATSQPTTDSTFTMPFELRDETVKVSGLAWFIDNASTGLVKMDNVSATEDKGNLFQSMLHFLTLAPRKETRKTSRQNPTVTDSQNKKKPPKQVLQEERT